MGYGVQPKTISCGQPSSIVASCVNYLQHHNKPDARIFHMCTSSSWLVHGDGDGEEDDDDAGTICNICQGLCMMMIVLNVLFGESVFCLLAQWNCEVMLRCHL